VGRRLNELELGERRGLRSPFRTIDVVLNLLPVSAAVYEDLLDTGIGEELEGVLDQRGICEG
jgi:hypothetical protein